MSATTWFFLVATIVTDAGGSNAFAALTVISYLGGV